MSKTTLSAPGDEPPKKKHAGGRPKNIQNETPEDWMNEVRLRAAESPKSCIEKTDPQGAARALWMLAQGCPSKDIVAATGFDRATVRDLGWRHNDTLETKRKKFSRRYAQVAEEFTNILFTKADRLADNPELLDAISPDKLAVTVGIMTDKAAMLSGMAGVVIEHRKGASIDDAAMAIAAAKARVAEKIKAQAIEAVIVEDCGY